MSGRCLWSVWNSTSSKLRRSNISQHFAHIAKCSFSSSGSCSYSSSVIRDIQLVPKRRPKSRMIKRLCPNGLRSAVSVEGAWKNVFPSRAALVLGAWPRVRRHVTRSDFASRSVHEQKKWPPQKGTATLVLGSELFVQETLACPVPNMGRLFKKCFKGLRIHSLTGGPQVANCDPP